MGHTLSGNHPVDFTRVDHLVRAERILMLKLAPIEVGHRSQTDVRMRSDVDALTGNELGRPHLIKKYEGTDQLPVRRRQGATNAEATEVTCTGHDQRVNNIGRIAGGRLRSRQGRPAHSGILRKVGFTSE